MQDVLRKDMNAFNTLTQVRLNTDLLFFLWIIYTNYTCYTIMHLKSNCVLHNTIILFFLRCSIRLIAANGERAVETAMRGTRRKWLFKNIIF